MGSLILCMSYVSNIVTAEQIEFTSRDSNEGGLILRHGSVLMSETNFKRTRKVFIEIKDFLLWLCGDSFISSKKIILFYLG